MRVVEIVPESGVNSFKIDKTEEPKEYRVLVKGDVIQQGDEWLDCYGSWNSTSSVGYKVGGQGSDLEYRRLLAGITPPTQSAPVPSTGKYDSAKPRVGLHPPGSILGASYGMTFGAIKYASHMWSTQGVEFESLINAAFRHVLFYSIGEELDPESKLPHLWHAQDCIAMLNDTALLHPEKDNRFKWPPEAIARLRAQLDDAAKVIAQFQKEKDAKEK